MLVQALKAALFSEGAKPATDRAVFEEARAAFYEASEDAFHDLLNALLEAAEAEGEARSRKWLQRCRRAAFSALSTPAPRSRSTTPNAPAASPGPSATCAASFAGYGKAGQALFQMLELPPPGDERGQERKAQWQVIRDP